MYTEVCICLFGCSIRLTADLESFHNHVLMYASKRYAFNPPVYEARVLLAALDYDFHLNRPTMKTLDGKEMYVLQLYNFQIHSTIFSKCFKCNWLSLHSRFSHVVLTNLLFFVCNLCNFSFKRLYKNNARRYSVYALKSEKTYGYISELQRRIVNNRLASGVGMPRRRSLRPDDPRQLGLVPPVPAPATSDLLQRQVKRGLGKLHKFVDYVVPYCVTECYLHYNIVCNYVWWHCLQQDRYSNQHLLWKDPNRRSPYMCPGTCQAGSRGK